MRVGGGRGGPGVGYVILRRGRGGCRGFLGGILSGGNWLVALEGRDAVLFLVVLEGVVWLTVSVGCEYVKYWNDKRYSSSVFNWKWPVTCVWIQMNDVPCENHTEHCLLRKKSKTIVTNRYHS